MGGIGHVPDASTRSRHCGRNERTAAAVNIVTHALLPAALAAPFLPQRSAREFLRAAGVVAVAGALPDLLHPHLSLAARFASWPHTVYAWCGVSISIAVLSAFAPRHVPARVGVAAVAAYALHLLCDAISGGIAWLYPADPQRLGVRWVRYEYWLVIDGLVTVVAAAVLGWKLRRVRPAASP